MLDGLTLRNRIFLFSSLLLLMAFLLMWIFVRPQYREAIINERTTIVSQLQEYSLKRSDQIIRNWLNSTNYTAEEIAKAPEQTQNIVTKTINLTPGLMRITISEQSSAESVDMRRSFYDEVDFSGIKYKWYPSRLDPMINVSWSPDTLQNTHFFIAKRVIQIGGNIFQLDMFFDASQITRELINIPLGGNYVANIVSGTGDNIVPEQPFEFPAFLVGDASYSSQSTIEMNGSNWFVMTSRFQTTPFWHVIAVEDSFILQPVHDLIRFSVITGGVILFILFCFSWYVSIHVNKPVEQIITDVEYLSALNFEHQIKPVSLPEFDLMQETLENIRLTLQRYQKINVERIILEESKNKYMMTYSEDLIGILDENQHFSFLNNNFQNFLNSLQLDPKVITPDEILEHADIQTTKLEQNIHYPDPYTIKINRAELSHSLKEGKSYFYDFQYVTIVDQEDNEQAAMIILHDKTEDRLNDIKRNDMINIIVHELKNPISGVIGLSQILLENENIEDEEQQVLVNQINLSGDRMNKLVNRFLEIQRLESGKNSAEFENVDLEKVVEHVQQITSPLLSEKNLTIDSKKTGRDFKVKGSSDLLFDAVQNLISNAIKYGNENRTIEIQLTEKPENIRFSVTDHGFGISTEDQKKIFDKFYRVRSKATSREKGTGLGLAYVREIIHQHDGEIELESNEAIGSRFTLIIPKTNGQSLT
ncbi:HAMP domain-containing sensor histidine kinase [Gracilimonas sp.]|uniref:sensor histidine kinase n=2 Tax=Gracilimonas sp. TaxID=1974203 RepID=UPI0025B7FF2E|nr:HAMP domain-containing sensor histidine kinase [Gracilimonas sp.]